MTAGNRFQDHSSDPQASSPSQHESMMQDWKTSSHRHMEAAEQPGPWAAAAQEDDSCSLVFEEEELGVIQEKDEELGVTGVQCCLASSRLQHPGKTTAAAPEGIHAYPNPSPNLQPQSQSQSQHSRQQSLHNMTLRRSESLHLQYECDSCPLVFLSDTDPEQHFTADAHRNTGYTQTHFATVNGQSQHSPQSALNSPVQQTQRGTLGDTARPAHQQPGHIADHMTGHMTAHTASHVFNMSQNHPQYSTDPQRKHPEAGSNIVLCDDFQTRPAGISMHLRQKSHVDGMSGSCGNIHNAQVSLLQL